jgi:hypothetical protein
MKKLIKSIIYYAVKNDYSWAILRATLVRTSEYVKFVRRGIDGDDNKIISEAIQSVCPGHAVKHGPFKGMKYPESKSVGSSLFPKLLGSYEKEIHPVIERICKRPYTEILDIGCAEGYYAVGLAIRIPTATVHAFDTNEEATRLCRSMAQSNDVDKRVITKSFCDENTLKTFPFTKRGLVFCDCEGYEKDLFTQDVIENLSKHDLLIEIHDGFDPSISSSIRQLFGKTHKLEVIDVLSDINRLRTSEYVEMENFDLKTRYFLLAEWRRNSTEWFYLESKA